jgi:hypothetical protein
VGEIDGVDMEATRRRTRQGLQELGEDHKSKICRREALGWETTEVEGEDNNSEFEPTTTNKGRAKTPRAPAAKRVQKLPKTLVKGSS